MASRKEFLDPARYSGLLISDPRISKIRIIKKFLSKSRDEWLSRDEKFCILTHLIDYLHFKCSVPILFLDSSLVFFMFVEAAKRIDKEMGLPSFICKIFWQNPH